MDDVENGRNLNILKGFRTSTAVQQRFTDQWVGLVNGPDYLTNSKESERARGEAPGLQGKTDDFPAG